MIKDYVDDNIKKHIREHVVLTIEDREIGIIGYLTPEVVYLSKTGSNTWINHTWCIITSQQIYYLFWFNANQAIFSAVKSNLY